MANKLERIPQIVAIVSIIADGRLSLKKTVREHLDLGDQRVLYLDMQTEVVLSTATVGGELAVDEKNGIHLPGEVLARLGITEQSLVGLVQRDSALAVKRVEINEREGECAVKRGYRKLTGFKAKVDKESPNGNASLCTRCGKCLEKCPQEIAIPDELEKAHAIWIPEPRGVDAVNYSQRFLRK